MKYLRLFSVNLLAVLLCLSAAESSFAAEELIIVFPFETAAGGDIAEVRDALPALMPSRLSVPGRLAVRVVESRGTAGEKTALAKRLGADYFLTGSITKVGASMSIDALLTPVRGDADKTPLYVQVPGKDLTIARITDLCTQVKEAILAKDAAEPPALPAAEPPVLAEPEDIAPPAPRPQAVAAGTPATILLPPPAAAASRDAEEQDRQQPAKYLAVPRQPMQHTGNPLFEANASASYMIKSAALTTLAMGDVNGDGRKELLVGGPESLFVYAVGAGLALSPVENIHLDKKERLVHVDTGDFNGNGIDEIYVSTYDGSESNSFVVEYRKGGYQRLVEKLPWFFRAYARAGGAAVLLGQAATVGNPFAGDIFSLRWDGATLTAGDKMKLPVTCSLYGFTEADIDNDSRPELFVFQRGMFDATLKLSILSPEGKTIWKDPHGLGATSLFFMRSISLSETDLKEPIPLRILCGRTDSGQPFLVVGKNAQKGDSFLNFLVKNTQGAACCFVWTGSSFEYNWASDFAKDFIADYILEDADGDGSAELFMLAVTGELSGSFALNRLQVFQQR